MGRVGAQPTKPHGEFGFDGVKNTPQVEYDTYRLLKKAIQIYLKEHTDQEVFVIRTKRGEWGEWFEYWHWTNGKAHIRKQGWM
jgi:hypothetical protein